MDAFGIFLLGMATGWLIGGSVIAYAFHRKFKKYIVK